MINLVCGDPKTKIWKANVLFKYDYKLWKIENMVVPVGTTGVNGLMDTPLTSSCFSYVEDFANSNALFIEEFGKVYTKVLSKGYENLQTLS